MADAASLRVIGFALGCMTALVASVAAVFVTASISAL
jgi:hypothetical protein